MVNGNSRHRPAVTARHGKAVSAGAAVFGSAERALEKGVGLCLMRGEEVLCEAFAGPAARGLIEISTTTGAPYRERGHATLACSRLIRSCEGLGYRTYWNRAAQSHACAAVARKLGYGNGRAYRLVAGFRSQA